ncbi:dihydropteroate synthase [Sphingorhabdus sp. 109]|jgi:dihydropteroate synthase|uniref:dihydropteroate synthase n=1 Tax=Sphingorhabdus sp. 109 TaxID=2653173 RepID=UPI0012F0245F|nr:dihydropteroate synthase [Sphingorhabdus sp. 109]VWX57637.1 Dihydropteroate synthase [Sphingorhabdus sp. 109]
MSQLEELEACGADSRLYLKPVGLVDSPQWNTDKNQRLNNSLTWFSQIEYLIVEAGCPNRRGLVNITQWPEWAHALPEPLAQRAQELFANLTRQHPALKCGDRTIRFDQPHVMGILNITPDSFSDGGMHQDDPEKAAEAGLAMAVAGSSILDIGGESTRPGANPVWEGDEIKRVVPVVERLAHCGAVLSVDTRKAAVMEAAIAAGAHLINDVSALLHDKRSLEVAGVSGLPVVLMHAPSSGKDPHKGEGYGNIVTDTLDWLEQRVAEVVAAGFERDKIIIDPGLGFGKSLTDNLALMNNIAMFHALGQPLLIGASRKRMIGALSREAPVDQRLGGSIAFAHHAIQQGAQIVRVHDVPETVQAMQIWRGMRDAGVTAPR